MDNITYCCEDMKTYYETEKAIELIGSSSIFGSSEGSPLELVITKCDPYGEFSSFICIKYCPSCGEKVEYEIEGRYREKIKRYKRKKTVVEQKQYRTLIPIEDDE